MKIFLTLYILMVWSAHTFADESLQKTIVHFWKTKKHTIGKQDHLSLVVQDLQTNQVVVEIATTVSIKSASLMKLLILEEFLRYQNKTKQTKRFQKDLTNMIQYSDNASFNKLVKILGGLQKTETLLHQNYPNTILVEYIPDTGKTYQNKIIVEELRQMLHKLWQGRLLGKEFSEQANRKASFQMLRLMQLPPPSQIADRLHAKTCLDEDQTTKLWDKTGFVRGSNGDAGIIAFQAEQQRVAYIIVSVIWRKDHQSIISNGKRWFQKSNFIHRRISEMTYAYFQKQYPGQSSCGADLFQKYTQKSSFELDFEGRKRF